MMQAGVMVMLIGLLIVAAASAPWQLAAGMAVASLGIAMFGPIPANVTATHWFTLRRGTAIAVVAAGGAVAGFGLPPLSAWLIESFGWRTALAGIGTGAAIIALPTLLLGLIPRPEMVGQTPDGLPAPTAATPGDIAAVADTARSWLATRDFWLLSVGMSLVLAVPIGLGLYLVPLLVERGMAAPRAALALSVAAVFGFIGTLAAGVLADRFPPKRVLLALVALLAISNASFAIWPGFWVAMIAAAGMGLGAGGVGPFLPLLVGLRFGASVVGRMMGVQGIIALPLVAVAPPAAGALREFTGHYEPAFLCAAAVLFAAGVVLALFSVHPPARK
jgi:MFS family permease